MELQDGGWNLSELCSNSMSELGAGHDALLWPSVFLLQYEFGGEALEFISFELWSLLN